MGLLDDPSTLAQLQLAGGLLSPGSFGQGLSRGLAGYQQTLATAQDMAAKKQAMDLQNIQMQQQKRMFDLQTPFLEEAVRRMNGGSSSQPSSDGAASAAPGLGAQSGSVGPTLENAQRMDSMPRAPQQSGGSMFPGVPDNVAFSTIGFGGFSKLPEIISKYNEPTEFTKTLTAAGIDPRSAQGQALIQANIAKTNYIAPVNARPGAILRDPRTMFPVAFNPHVPEGGTPVFDASGNVVAINPLQGATDVIRAKSAAEAGGKAQFTPYAGYDASGRPAPVTSVSNVLSPTAPSSPNVIPPQQQADADKERLRILQDERASTKPGPDRDALDREIKRTQNSLLTNGGSSRATGGVFAAPPLGAEKGANNAQDTMAQSYRSVMASNQPAQTVQARLDNISQLATRAITGGDTEWRDYANNLLHIAGISDKATDRKTAGDLIDKNAAQISLAIGSGTQGTDALRALASAANPNRHMTPDAIREAVDQLKASARVQQAKAQVLAPHYTSGNPNAYVQAEQLFDKNADYRLWQLKDMPPAQAQKYLSSLPPGVMSELQQKARAMKDMGAL